MSLPEMQTALAMIVRYPAAFQGDYLTPLLAEYDLTASERASLRQIAENRELGKFGFGLLDMRWSMADARLPLVKRAVPQQTLFEIFQDLFDGQSVAIPNRDLAWHFLSFLEQDERVAERLKDAPAYLADFIAFERAQLEIERDRWQGLAEPEESSPLATYAFYPLAFDHDLAGYLQAISEGAEVEAPLRKKSFALLLGTETLPGYRLFELDEETYQFLRKARAGESVPLPTTHADLIDAGLCKGKAVRHVG